MIGIAIVRTRIARVRIGVAVVRIGYRLELG